MTPQRMRDAAQILGELGNGKMANELTEVANRLQTIADEATAHYDSLGEPYPPHLNSLLTFLGAK